MTRNIQRTTNEAPEVSSRNCMAMHASELSTDTYAIVEIFYVNREDRAGSKSSENQPKTFTIKISHTVLQSRDTRSTHSAASSQ